MNLPDYSEWLTDERLKKEEEAWSRAGFHLTFLKHIDFLRETFPGRISSVLEIGCGIGLVPSLLDNSILYRGLDRNRFCVLEARARNPGKTFLLSDIRFEESSNKLELMSDLVCAFAFLKHFSLDEWNSIFSKVLSFGKEFALFTVSLSSVESDDGTEFHHVWITPEHLVKGLSKNGYRLICEKVLWADGLKKESIVSARREETK